MTMVRVPFTAALEHVYDDNVAQAIELDKHGSFLYFLPSLFVHAHAPGRLFGELEASLARSQSRPHAFGLLPPAECAASSCGHQQWYAVGPSLRANSRWRRSAWPLETEDELAPVAEIRAAAQEKVASLMPTVGPFNSVLVNCYPDGASAIKWHADDESCYGDANSSTIASVSFGARRSFCLRSKLRGEDGEMHQLLRKIALPSGSLLIMCGATQAFWQHSLPPDTKHPAKRINLTFRHVFFPEPCARHHHASKTLDYLEQQALVLLKSMIQGKEHWVHVCTLSVGDCIILHLLSRLSDFSTHKNVCQDRGEKTLDSEGGSAASGMGGRERPCRMLVVDSLHLQEETLPFLEVLRQHYAVNVHLVRPKGCETKLDFSRTFGESLHASAVHRYREVCWQEPLARGLRDLSAEILITARRRDQGGKHAQVLPVLGGTDTDLGLPSVNPLAHWTFEDCFDYAAKYKILLHPLLALGFPAPGDVHITACVPPDGTVHFADFKFSGRKEAWLDYGCEHKGLSQG